jgi:hypothetical protein
MRKLLAILVVLAIVGALIVGISGKDIVDYCINFMKNLCVFILNWLKQIADFIQDYIISHVAS